MTFLQLVQERSDEAQVLNTVQQRPVLVKGREVLPAGIEDENKGEIKLMPRRGRDAGPLLVVANHRLPVVLEQA